MALLFRGLVASRTHSSSRLFYSNTRTSTDASLECIASANHFSSRLFYSYTETSADPSWDSNSAPGPCIDLLEYQLAQLDLPSFQVGSSTYASLLQHCALAKTLNHGQFLHLILVKKGLDTDVFIKNHLIHMYGKCDALHEARVLFYNMSQRNIFSWNIMIGVYAQYHGNGIHDALELFSQMRVEGVIPDKVTFVHVLSSVCSHDFSFVGKCVHASLAATDAELDVVVGTALISMYSICGSLGNARSLFCRMPARNVISWSALISACAHHNQGEEALELFSEMELQGLVPTKMTLVSCLSACATLAAQTTGFNIHTCIISMGFDSNTFIGTALVDMYGKSGDLKHAEVTFSKMLERNVLSWTAMMAVYAMHGQSKHVISLFEQMQTKDAMPDNISFLCALSACSHLGLPEESYLLFASMRHHYGIKPTLEHFNCIIDLLGRVGSLEECEILIRNMPYEANDSSWLSLLAACKVHFDGERAQRTAGCVFRLDPDNVASCLLLLGIF